MRILLNTPRKTRFGIVRTDHVLCYDTYQKATIERGPSVDVKIWSYGRGVFNCI